MKVVSIAIALALLKLVGGSGSPPLSLVGGSNRLAIARPFSEKDAHNLVHSFDAWNQFPPCNGDPSFVADLVLVFSGHLKNSTIARDAMEGARAIFEATNGFGNCFDKLLGLGCNIEPSEDVYLPMEASSNPLWVNGPNRQWEILFRAMLASNYSFFGLFEMDSIPVHVNWLDALVEEIESQQDEFAILGRCVLQRIDFVP